jgi:catechol 2,3-dioxygenase-like lactoylglutathione lyase family enzyme
VIDHLSLQVADVARSRAFYEVLLARLGLRAAYTDGPAVGFVDEQGAPFWILPADLHEPTGPLALFATYCVKDD